MNPCPRLVALSDEARLSRPDASARIAALARAGCPAVLLRPGAMGPRPLLALARGAAGACREAGTELWIGDRLDVALAAGANGVQLPARGLSTRGARRAAEAARRALRIGRSVHGAEEAAAAARDGADHVLLGAIFPTASHPGVSPGGPALVSAARDAMASGGRAAPILAVGGMTPDTAAEAVRAGAWGAAALSGLWDAPDAAAAVAAYLRAMEAARA